MPMKGESISGAAANDSASLAIQEGAAATVGVMLGDVKINGRANDATYLHQKLGPDGGI
jgi:hypothetical protein